MKKFLYIISIFIVVVCGLWFLSFAFAGDSGLNFPTSTGETFNDWTDPTNAFADDAVYATFGCFDPDPGLDISLSWDGGTSYTSAIFQGWGVGLDIYTTKDTWGRSWSVDDFSNTNFRAKFVSPCGGAQDYYDFGFSFPSGAVIVDIEINVEGSYNGAGAYFVDYIQIKIYYTTTCNYNGSGDWNVLEEENCYATTTVYVNGSFNLIGSTTGQFGCADGIKVSAENFNFGTAPTSFDLKCFAHH